MEKKDDFWFVLLCVLLSDSACVGLDIYLRIEIAANAVVVLMSVAKQVCRYVKNSKNTKS